MVNSLYLEQKFAWGAKADLLVCYGTKSKRGTVGRHCKGANRGAKGHCLDARDEPATIRESEEGGKGKREDGETVSGKEGSKREGRQEATRKAGKGQRAMSKYLT
ncbi:hypothetical protein PIIN_01090 [Serendipita indica DSM 11827]|uniref:Uncharacterized protein n=1 Tax=Serendipita indica (strain DSM 11827) TaxID=1109443 RepID=G4T7D9_SERID|nr:hypothetical protein PIIN_01090 [Serendipita indica DSM 11827]